MIIKLKIPVSVDYVNINDLGELIWWTAHLGIGPEKLLFIIDKVGTSAKDIRKYSQLKINEPSSNILLFQNNLA